MTRRITRAKLEIKDSGVAFTMPSNRERAERLRAVLHVLYLIFNEGYVSTSGPSLDRADLTAEAIRLTRMAHGLLPTMARWPASSPSCRSPTLAGPCAPGRWAHPLEMAGDRMAARDSYLAAARRATNLTQQRYLHSRAARLTNDR